MEIGKRLRFNEQDRMMRPPKVADSQTERPQPSSDRRQFLYVLLFALVAHALALALLPFEIGKANANEPDTQIINIDLTELPPEIEEALEQTELIQPEPEIVAPKLEPEPIPEPEPVPEPIIEPTPPEPPRVIEVSEPAQTSKPELEIVPDPPKPAPPTPPVITTPKPQPKAKPVPAPKRKPKSIAEEPKAKPQEKPKAEPEKKRPRWPFKRREAKRKPSSGDANGSTGSTGSTGPVATRSPKPLYPKSAREAGAEGTTLLRVQILVNGRPGTVTIARSSGNAVLDQSAMKTVRSRWRFKPATKNGSPFATYRNIPVTFKLL
jgi:protein TonB